MQPVLFLDVDGVLNALGLGGECYDDWDTAICMGYKIYHSKQMGKELEALPVEIRWLTTWCDNANKWISPLFDWQEYPVAAQLPGSEGGLWVGGNWKFDAIKQFVQEQHRPFIWVDDDAIEAFCEAWLIQNCSAPFLLIRTSLMDGLTANQIKEIEAFLELPEVKAYENVQA